MEYTGVVSYSRFLDRVFNVIEKITVKNAKIADINILDFSISQEV
jgi:hypothetical protein